MANFARGYVAFDTSECLYCFCSFLLNQIDEETFSFFVNLTINLEPIYGIILALLIFGESEKMSLGFYLGTSLILSSILLYPLLNRKSKKKTSGI